MDLFVLDAQGDVRSKDDDADAIPVVSVNTQNASNSGLRITNARSSGRSLVLTAYLDVDAQ